MTIKSSVALIDTHAHLEDEKFADDRHEVILRAKQEGIQTIINVGSDLITSRCSIELAQRYDFIYATVGVHPHDAVQFNDNHYSSFLELTKNKKVVGIGEIGLDYYRNLSPQPVQQEVFRQFIRLARMTNLPVIVHDREAHSDILKILKEEKANVVSGVLHSFSGDVDMLKEVINAGFYISISGAVTYADSLVKIIKVIPLERLLLETDCPYLTPVPYRGKRNEPVYLKHTAAKISQILGMNIQKIADITTSNAGRLFNI
ncbi:MAG: TatD family hydrolase [bacterium]